MQRILFVCLGNICRSPLAEGIMLHLKEKHDLNIEIDSAGTASYHIGEAPDPRTIANARRNGIDLSPLRARQFSKKDLEEFHYIFVMDQSNLSNVLKLNKESKYEEKVGLLTQILNDSKYKEVPDPYYGSEKDFEEVFQLAYKCCNRIAEKIMAGEPLI